MDIKKRFLQIVAVVGLVGMVSSCTTSYDAYGRPQQTVDPGLAVAGIAVAALVGYAIANDGGGHRGHGGGHGGRHYDHGGHGGGRGGHGGGYHGGACY